MLDKVSDKIVHVYDMHDVMLCQLILALTLAQNLFLAITVTLHYVEIMDITNMS